MFNRVNLPSDMKKIFITIVAVGLLLFVPEQFGGGGFLEQNNTDIAQIDAPKNEKQTFLSKNLTSTINIDLKHSHFFRAPDNIASLLAENKFSKIYLIVGKIDKEFFKTIVDIPIRGANLIVMSPGGRADYGSKVSQLIYEEGHNVVVYGLCVSACAEFILPAAHKIYFEKLPMIGFHGNTLGYDFLVNELSRGETHYCPQTIGGKDRLLNIYKKRNLNQEFWKEQYRHLVVEKQEMTLHSVQLDKKYDNVVVNGQKLSAYYDNCGTVKVTTKHKMWYPTSKQLREDFRLKFTGEVCADHYKCYSERLNKLGKDGDSYAVGNTVYVVKKLKAQSVPK